MKVRLSLTTIFFTIARENRCYTLHGISRLVLCFMGKLCFCSSKMIYMIDSTTKQWKIFLWKVCVERESVLWGRWGWLTCDTCFITCRVKFMVWHVKRRCDSFLLLPISCLLFPLYFKHFIKAFFLMNCKCIHLLVSMLQNLALQCFSIFQTVCEKKIQKTWNDIFSLFQKNKIHTVVLGLLTAPVFTHRL